MKMRSLAWLLCLAAIGCGDKSEPEIGTGKMPALDILGGTDGDAPPKDVQEPEELPGPTDGTDDVDDIPDTLPEVTPPDEGLVEEVTDDVPDVPDIEQPPPDYTTCDAGDEAWAKRTIQVLVGRKPNGIREVRVLVDLIAEIGRRKVALGLMKLPAFEVRWADWLMDEIRINRVGDKTHKPCYGYPQQPDDKGEVAAFIRDNGPNGNGFGMNFNMTDVLRSSLRLDDLSPLYMAHLFAMMAKPLTGANVAALEMDITRRQDFGEIFEAVYLHRNVVCVGCHNSQFSTTDNADPALDRHWPIPGNFESAIYGQSSGIPEMTLYSIFRRLNVVRDSGGKRPWGLDASCGRFNEPAKIPIDPAGFSAFFINELGQTASVWDTEAALHAGFDQLRAQGKLIIDAETGNIDGYQAFAYMVSARITNQLWKEVLGYPLTLVHYFPRNPAQRDILLELTNNFVASHWSLKTLLANVVTHPFYNENAPIDGCGPDTPYHLAQIFNPWSVAEETEDLHPNSTGDLVHRANSRILLSATAHALGWQSVPAFPEGAEEEFQKAIGVFVKDGEPGFGGVDFQGMLTWENRYGACKSQNTGSGANGPAAASCAGKCDSEYDENAPCQCDPQCSDFDDCCSDYEELCVNGEQPGEGEEESGGADWITNLVTAVNTALQAPDSPLITLRDVVIALKDRLITEPDLEPGKEPAFIAKLMEVDSLDVSVLEVANWPSRLRRYCGALLETPQFLLEGMPAFDQMTQPTLVVDGSDYKTQCEALGLLMVDAQKFKVECENDSLTIAPVPTDPADLQ